MQWAWDKRKTKPKPEERSIQEPVKMMVESINEALTDKIQGGVWRDEARNFGKYVKTACDMMVAFDCGFDVVDYPRVMYEATRILDNDEGGQQHAEPVKREGGERQPA